MEECLLFSAYSLHFRCQRLSWTWGTARWSLKTLWPMGWAGSTEIFDLFAIFYILLLVFLNRTGWYDQQYHFKVFNFYILHLIFVCKSLLAGSPSTLSSLTRQAALSSWAWSLMRWSRQVRSLLFQIRNEISSEKNKWSLMRWSPLVRSVICTLHQQELFRNYETW